MNLPHGKILLEKKINRQEIDDTITDEVDVILFLPEEPKGVIQVYLKETGEKIIEFTFAVFLKKALQMGIISMDTLKKIVEDNNL